MLKQSPYYSSSLKPNILYVSSKKLNNTNLIETIFKLCLANTTNISIEIFENNSSIYLKSLKPNTLFNELLCVLSEHKIIHKNDIKLVLKNCLKEEIFKLSSNKKIEINIFDIKVVNSKMLFKKFIYNNAINFNNSHFIKKIYLKINLKIRYLFLKIKQLVMFTLRTLISIIRYLVTSKNF